MVGRPLHTFSIIRNLLSKLFNKEFLVFFILPYPEWALLAHQCA